MQWLKTDFFFKKPIRAVIKLLLNSLKLGTIVYVMIPTCKKDPNKNIKVAFFEYYIVCIRLVFRKPNFAKIKVSSNHLKFCTGCFFLVFTTKK